MTLLQLLLLTIIIIINYYYDNFIYAKTLETQNTLIDKKNYMGLTIYFTKYIPIKFIKMLSFHYHKSMGKIKEHKENKYLMVELYTR